MPQAQEPYQPW